MTDPIAILIIEMILDVQVQKKLILIFFFYRTEQCPNVVNWLVGMFCRGDALRFYS